MAAGPNDIQIVPAEDECPGCWRVLLNGENATRKPLPSPEAAKRLARKLEMQAGGPGGQGSPEVLDRVDGPTVLDFVEVTEEEGSR